MSAMADQAREEGKVAAIDPKGALPDSMAIPTPRYGPMRAAAAGLAFTGAPGSVDFYPGPMIGAEALGKRFVEDDSRYVRQALELMRRLSPDDYVEYLIRYFEDGLDRFGEHWGYADIVTILLGLTEQVRPTDYLEIGVRRGRSACAVGSLAPDCAMVLFDMWLPNYAGMENPGPDLVRAELAKVGHRGPTQFIDGNSHETVPAYFREHANAAFDIITVDGDHTNLGAAQDLADILPRLKIGGAVVFDDICHPAHPGLRDVWRRLVQEDRRFSYYNYQSVGYGVGFAVRKY
jgi:predicted O-methyltransferase YrrM